MRRHALGLTLVELITVVAIIAILVGLLVPAVNVARRFAKETQQRVQLTAIDMALTTFKSDTDFVDYPPSNASNATGGRGTGMTWYTSASYCGAQKLAEALVGRDMRGFHPRAYSYLETTSGMEPAQGAGPVWYPVPGTVTAQQLNDNWAARKPLYLDPGTANAFRLGDLSANNQPGLYPLDSILSLAPDTFVLCDVYVRKTVVINNGGVAKEVKLGSPILYYKANTSGSTNGSIYQYGDNVALISAKEGNDNLSGPWRPTGSNLYATAETAFYNFINDPRISTDPLLGRPYRPDSYILVSAGADGMYGTRDDVCNFSR